MIKLSNISKYYHNQGVVTLALHKIDLEFKMGEFVAITGESGSGKSTLLNVIAGIDSYEDGELYINGEETSYFDDSDWEAYRRNKIGFIFQNYNLIDSYTVLRNVEVALVIQGISKEERTKRAKEIINKVGLGRHLKQRASKLSGGEKQRLAIARALAKDTNIIVADEPTGNLDSKSGKQILELLNEVAKDKLVFIVTHNYEQASPYVSRKIRLFDGEVVEDKVVKGFEEIEVKQELVKTNNELVQSLQIAKINIFSQPRKSILLFLVSLAIVFFVFSVYTTLNVDTSYNYGELNNYPERLIITRKDRQPLTDEDYNLLKDNKKIEKVILEDEIIDGYLSVRNEYNDYSYNFYFTGQILFNLQPTKDSLLGRLPEKEDEIVLNTYYWDEEIEEIEKYINKEVEFIYYKNGPVYNDIKMRFTIVGINKLDGRYNNRNGFVLTDEGINRLYKLVQENKIRDLITIEFGGMFQDKFDVNIKMDPSLNYLDVKIRNFEVASTDKVILKDKKLNVIESKNDSKDSVVYISKQLYNELYPNEITQYSVNLKNVDDRVDVEKALYNQGYYSFSPHYDVKLLDYMRGLSIIGAIGAIIGSLFSISIIYLISYLVYKLIMNTKIKDYTILRIIGAKRTLITNLIRTEMLISFISAYIVFVGFYLYVGKTYPVFENLRLLDFFIVFIINTLLSLLIARRFIKKQVAKTLYTTLRTE